MKKLLNARYHFYDGRAAVPALSCAVLLAIVSTGYSQEKVLSLGEGAFFSVVWSPNGELVAASSFDIKANSKKIVVAEATTEKIVREFTGGPTGQFSALAFSKDSRAVYSLATRRGDDKGAMTSDVQCWNIETGKEGKPINLPGYGKFLSERFLVTAISPKQEIVNVFDHAVNKRVMSVKLESRLEYTVISKDGKYLATVERAGPVNVWDLSTGGVVCTLKFRAHAVQKVCFLPKEPAIAAFRSEARIYEIPTGKEIEYIDHHMGAEAVSPDGDMIAGQAPFTKYNIAEKRAEHSLNGINLYSRKQGGMVAIIKLEPKTYVSHLQFSPDGRSVLARCNDGRVHIWEISKLKQ